ncbi:MAG: hypothetical protein RIC12_00830, partial [Pirellulales bacterium]
PVVGDWDGDGIDTIGVYDQRLSIFNLRNDNSPGGADAAVVNYGPAKAILDLETNPLLPWLPIAGDWDGNSIPLTARIAPDEEQAAAPSLSAGVFTTVELAWSSLAIKAPDLFTNSRTEVDQLGLSELDEFAMASSRIANFDRAGVGGPRIVSDVPSAIAVDHAIGGSLATTNKDAPQSGLDYVDQLTSSTLNTSAELAATLGEELSPGTDREGDVQAIDRWFSRLD